MNSASLAKASGGKKSFDCNNMSFTNKHKENSLWPNHRFGETGSQTVILTEEFIRRAKTLTLKDVLRKL